MRQKTKITIAALAVMLFMALAVTFISFIFADNTSGGDGTATAEAADKTNIDYIIQNSNDETLSDENRKYRIVEIGAGAASTLSNYTSELGFENHVINGNKTDAISELFATGNVQYIYLNGSEITSSSAQTTKLDDEGKEVPVLDYTAISQADMIYVSNFNGTTVTYNDDGTIKTISCNPGYNTDNDISEELFSILQPLAIGSYIPVIVDIPSKSGSNSTLIELTAKGQVVGNVIHDSYEAKGSLYYQTFGYTEAEGVDGFFATGTGSWDYLAISARDRYKYYTSVKETAESESTSNMGHILVVSKDGTSGLAGESSLVKKFLAGAEEVESLVDANDTSAEVKGTVSENYAIYNISGTTFSSEAYNSRYNQYNPVYLLAEEIKIDDLPNVDFDQYDMVFMESGLGDYVIPEDDSSIELAMTTLMTSNMHVVYDTADSRDGNYESSNIKTTGANPDEAKGTIYEKFYNYVSSNGIANYENIMLTDKSVIDTITQSNSDSSAKTLADLINAASYRGIGGPKSTSSKFSVLEIQPCYPIDTDIVARNLANGKSGYYNDATNILNGMSKEEIESQLGLSGQSTDSYEYYAWELSKAKIANAIGIDASQITLTQMSTEEFSSYKGEILGSYDLIYIGGNTSALKGVDEYYSYVRTGFDYNTFATSFFKNATDYEERCAKLPIYTMYTHNGEFSSTNITFHASGQGSTGSVTVGTVLNGTPYKSSYTQLNGNDISSDNLERLESYVAAGMPVLISDDVSYAYGAIVTKYDAAKAEKEKNSDAEDPEKAKYAQNSIDPDSNMCKFLDYCYNKQKFTVLKDEETKTSYIKVYGADGELVDFADGSSVMWNFQATTNTQMVSSNSGIQLSSYANTVSVLSDEQSDYLRILYNTSSKRPKLVVTSKPEQYNLNNASSITESSTLKFTIDESMVKKNNASINYTMNLYIDDSGNSIFESDEKLQSVTNTAEISAALSADFSGPVYWKLELIDNSTKATVSQTGLAYVTPSDVEQQEVSLLQILPGHRVLTGCASGIEGGDGGGSNGLYFCTVCQQSYKIDYYNPFSSTGYGALDYYYGSNHFSDKNVSTTGYHGSVKAGLHEHNFGIVSYDDNLSIGTGSSKITGIDDWYHNLADDLEDYFKFDVQILYVDDFERYADEIANVYSGLTESEIEATQEAYSEKAETMKSLYEEKEKEVDAAEAELNELIEYIISNLDDSNTKYTGTSKNGWQSWQSSLANDTATRKKALENIEKQGTYSEFFAMSTNFSADLSEGYPGVANGTYKPYLELYENWVTLHDEMLILKGGYYVNAYTYPYFIQMRQYLESDDKAYYDSFKNAGLSDAGTTDCPRIFGYQDYEKFAAGLDWLKTCYTSVCIGPSENFGGDDITSTAALSALVKFVNNDGQLVLFHDTFSAFEDAGSTQLTATLRELAGADKYHVDTDTADTTYAYTKYTTTDTEKYPSSIYFTTNLTNDSSDSKYSGYAAYVKDALNNPWFSTNYQYTVTGLTDTYLTARTDDNNKIKDNVIYSADVYEYAEMNWGEAATWNFSAATTKANTTYATDRATKNNDAIVTMFPFSLADEMYIGGTHPQALALDIDDDEVTVLYSLAGGTSAHNQTSILAADPGDGTDNYFIYYRKNIFYCGAGHGKITGMQKDNLNERYLYMNIICNSVRQSALAPTIGVYDDTSTEKNLTNNVVKKQSDGSYLYQIDDDTKYPSFSFKVGVDDDAVLKKVEVYYDLDYGKMVEDKDDAGNVKTNADGSVIKKKNTSDDYDSTSDVMIASWGLEGLKNQTFTADLLGHICDDAADTKHGSVKHSSTELLEKFNVSNLVTGADETLTELVLRVGDTTTYGKAEAENDYFAPYDGNYTYIVIKATSEVTIDNKKTKKITYKRIKILRKDHLFNLT